MSAVPLFPSRERHTTLGIAAALFLAALLLFLPAVGYDFVYYDDYEYVVNNQGVNRGLDAASLRWAFQGSIGYIGNSDPLTWLSHMVDVELFGARPAGHHATNVFLHALNAALLFVLLRVTTGRTWAGAFAAAFFALHPLRVQAVAWVAARKDVLSGFFFMLCLLAYAGYVRRPSPRRYAAVALFFALGLLAKPMLVVLPFVLLLLDVWPLGRLGAARRGAGRATFTGVVAEKAPLLLAAAAWSAVTYRAQSAAGAVVGAQGLPPWARLANAAVSYVNYLRQTIWPAGLAVDYPHPGTGISVGAAALCALALAAATALAFRWARSAPWAAVSWFWYLGTLVPVIGLVQIGDFSRADRFTYLPSVGIAVLVSWGGAALARRTGAGRPALAALSLTLLTMLAALTLHELSFWRDSETLFRHSLRASPGSCILNGNLANYLADNGRQAESVAYYRQALLATPTLPNIYLNLGLTLSQLGRKGEAALYYRAAKDIDPDKVQSHVRLGGILEAGGLHDEALAHFQAALRVRRDYLPALRGLERSPQLRRRQAAGGGVDPAGPVR